jgi:hypothetical protein
MVHPSEYGNRKKFEDVSRKVGKLHPSSKLKNAYIISNSQRSRSKGNLLQAVRFVADNWRGISSKTIQNCFSHCGLKHPRLEMPNTSGIENEATLELQRVRNHEALCSDNSPRCYNQN